MDTFLMELLMAIEDNFTFMLENSITAILGFFQIAFRSSHSSPLNDYIVELQNYCGSISK